MYNYYFNVNEEDGVVETTGAFFGIENNSLVLSGLWISGNSNLDKGIFLGKGGFGIVKKC